MRPLKGSLIGIFRHLFFDNQPKKRFKTRKRRDLAIFQAFVMFTLLVLLQVPIKS